MKKIILVLCAYLLGNVISYAAESKITGSVRPEDILPDNINSASVNGVKVRKGSVAAFLANLSILENANATQEQKLAALQIMKELAPAMNALGLHKHAVFKNAKVEKILVDAE